MKNIADLKVFETQAIMGKMNEEEMVSNRANLFTLQIDIYEEEKKVVATFNSCNSDGTVIFTSIGEATKEDIDNEEVEDLKSLISIAEVKARIDSLEQLLERTKKRIAAENRIAKSIKNLNNNII